MCSLNREYSNMSAEEIYGFLKEICALGGRWTGSDGNVKACNYIFDKFQKFRLDDVRLEEFKCLGYWPTSSELEILSPVQKIFPADP